MTAENKFLQGRVALVTGGARGIGEAVSRNFVEMGARVVLVDNGAAIDGRSVDNSVAESIADSLGESVVGVSLDVGSSKAARDAVQVALDQFKRLDLVVNCAAILRDHFIFKSRPADFDEVLRVNLAGAYYVIAAAAPIFREQAKSSTPDDPYTWGRVINIVSTAGFYGNYGQASYASAKSGLLGLTRVAALDLARSGIRVNAVAPFARTRVTDIIVPANEEQARYKERAMKISPDYVATVVSWLCSDHGNEISGQLFGVRGREVFLFSQPRPSVSIGIDENDWGIEGLAKASKENFQSKFSDLKTDLESFNTEPLI